jgi:hypothetical protein
MLGLIKIIVTILSLFIGLGAAYNFLGDKNRAMVANWIANWTHAGFDAAIPVLHALEGALGPITVAFVAAFKQYGGPIATDIQGAIAPVIRTGLDTSAAGLTSRGVSTPDNALQMAADALVDAFGFGISSAAVTAAFEAVFPEKLNTLNGVGPMLAQMAGFDEVQAAVRGPLYEAAFGHSLKYHFRSVFKPELPSEDDAVSWHARRFIDDTQLKKIFDYSGLKPEYEAPYIQSAYRAIQPRALATLFQDAPLDEALMKDLLEKAGIFPQHIQPLIVAFRENSVKNVRNQYLSAIETAAERGNLTPAEVDSALTTLNFSNQAKGWVHLTIATRKLQQLEEIYRKSVSEAYHYGLIADVDYVPHLQAIGINIADAQAHYAVDSIKKQGTALVAAQRQAAADARKLEAAAVHAALAEFEARTIDALALSVALIAAGMAPALAAFAVAIATARQQAKQVVLFGKLMTHHEAQLLREQILAIRKQATAKLLSPQEEQTQLEQVGVPTEDALAMVSKDFAQTYKVVLPYQ